MYIFFLEKAKIYYYKKLKYKEYFKRYKGAAKGTCTHQLEQKETKSPGHNTEHAKRSKTELQQQNKQHQKQGL
jgi:hypothetical protein